jgi:hypothetical protein
LVPYGTYLVCARWRILLGYVDPVLSGGGWPVVTIPLMHLDSCTLPTREGEEDSERILALASVTRYGPAYDRGVAENLGKYMLMVNKQDFTSAEYFLDRAEKAYEYARERKIKWRRSVHIVKE